MYQKNGNNKMVFGESLKVTVLGILLLLMGEYLPVFSLVVFFLPIVMSFFFMAFPLGYAIGGIGVWMIFALGVLQSPGVFYMLFLFLLLSASFVLLRPRKIHSSWIILSGTILMAVGMVAGLYVLTKGEGSLLSPLTEGYQQALTQGMLKDLSQGTGLNITSLLKQMEMLLPGVMVNLSIVIAILNYYGTNYVLERRRLMTSSQGFSEFALPGNIAGGIIIIYGGLFLLKVMKFPLAQVIQLNGVMIFTLLFFLQGLAVLRYWIRGRLSLVLRWIIFLGALLIAPVSMAVLILGFIDGVVNFRKLPR